MSLNIYIFFVACSSIVVLSSTVPEPRLVPPGNIKVNQTCKRDHECIKHAFCQGQKTCACDPYYAPTPDMATCRVTAGAPCIGQEGCSTMTNAKCSQNVCACSDNFIINPKNSSDCILFTGPRTQSRTQPAGPNTHSPNHLAGPNTQNSTQPAGPRTQNSTELAGPRNQNSTQLAGPRTQSPTHPAGPRNQGPIQLTGLGPRASEGISQCDYDCNGRTKGARCINGKCVCDTDHRFVKETNTCVKIRGLNESCNQNYECFLNKTGSNALECKNGKCAEHTANPSKKNGCPVHQPILMVLVTLIVGTTLQKFV